MPSVALVSLLCESVVCSACVEFMTTLVEVACDFYGMSHILFGVGGTFLKNPVLLTLTTVGDDVVDKRLIVLLANVTFLGWNPVLFSMLLLALFESKLQWR